MQLSHLQKLSVSIGASLVVLGGFGAVSYYYASRLVAADRAVERANANMEAALRMVVARQDGERLTKAYVVRPDSETRAMLGAVHARVEDALELMRRGTEDNPRQLVRVQALATGAAQNFEAFLTTVLIRDRAGLDSARRFLSGGPPARAADSLMKLVNEIREDELRVLGERARLQSEHGASAQRVILVSMVLAFLLAGVALQPMRTHVASRMTSRIAREHLAGADVPAEDADERSRRQLDALQRFAAMLAAPQGASVAQALVDAMAPLEATLVAVAAPDERGTLRVLASSAPAFASVPTGFATPIEKLLRTGEATLVESRAERERRWGLLPELDARGATGALLLTPVVNAGLATGVLVIAHDGDRVFADHELNFAATLGRLGGVSLVSVPSPL